MIDASLSSSLSSIYSSGSAKSNRIVFSTIPGSPQDLHDIQEQSKPERIFPLSANPSIDTIDTPSITPMIDEQENEHEHVMNSDDDDEHIVLPMDDGQTECKTIEIFRAVRDHCTRFILILS
jgi:hypothetical protein